MPFRMIRVRIPMTLMDYQQLPNLYQADSPGDYEKPMSIMMGQYYVQEDRYHVGDKSFIMHYGAIWYPKQKYFIKWLRG